MSNAKIQMTNGAEHQMPKSKYQIWHLSFDIWHSSVGFTLIEALFVLAMIGILATMVATRMSRDIASEEDAKQAAYMVAQSMNFARSNAFSHSSENTTGYTLKFFNGSGGETPPYVKGSVINLYAGTTDPYDVKVPGGVTCNPVNLTDSAQRFDFLPDG